MFPSLPLALAASLGLGTAAEVARRTLGVSTDELSRETDLPFLTKANIERIVDTLCKVRGAALKIGQMISLQGTLLYFNFIYYYYYLFYYYYYYYYYYYLFYFLDNSFMPEPIQEIFERVRSNADFMPFWQLEAGTCAFQYYNHF